MVESIFSLTTLNFSCCEGSTQYFWMILMIWILRSPSKISWNVKVVYRFSHFFWWWGGWWLKISHDAQIPRDLPMRLKVTGQYNELLSYWLSSTLKDSVNQKSKTIKSKHSKKSFPPLSVCYSVKTVTLHQKTTSY